jgi:hypothetical protein
MIYPAKTAMTFIKTQTRSKNMIFSHILLKLWLNWSIASFCLLKSKTNPVLNLKEENSKRKLKWMKLVKQSASLKSLITVLTWNLIHNKSLSKITNNSKILNWWGIAKAAIKIWMITSRCYKRKKSIQIWKTNNSSIIKQEL